MLSLSCFSDTKQSSVFIAIIFAKDTIHKFEKDHPSDMRPRKAIEAAEAWLNNRTEENARIADTAYVASYVCASISGYAAVYAAYAAATAIASSAVFAAYASASYAAYFNSTFNNTYSEAENHIHEILFKNLSVIINFHIDEVLFLQQPEVVFKYLNEEQKEEFIYEMDILCKA